MKIVGLLLGLILWSRLLVAQVFEPLANGLVYEETGMQTLKQAVDSLHALYQANQQVVSVASLPQGKGYALLFFISKKDKQLRQEITQALEQKMPLEIFQEKYIPPVTKDFDPALSEEILIQQCYQINASGDTTVYLYPLQVERPSHSTRIQIQVRLAKPIEHQTQLDTLRWVYYWNKDLLQAFYFPKGLSIPTLPPSYAATRAYVDALLAPDEPLLMPTEDNTPSFELYKQFRRRGATLENFSRTRQQELLDSLRQLQIEPFCGADESPGHHAWLLAALATHLGNCPVFLKAHLAALENYTMVYENGYYLEAEFSSYCHGMKELEYLGIDFSLLIKGLLVHPNTSYQDILEKGILFLQERELVLNEVLTMAQDSTLDLLHRRAAAEFYSGVLYHWSRLKKDPALDEYIQKFEQVRVTLPLAIQGKLYSPHLQKTSKRRGRRG